MYALNENVEVAIQTEQVSMPNSATQTEQVFQAKVGTQTLQAGQPEVSTQTDQANEAEIATQTYQAREQEVATQTEQVRQPEVATQTNEIKPEAPQPMFEKFPDNSDEVCTRHKTFQSKTEKIYLMEQLSPQNSANAPRADRIASRRRLCSDQVDYEPPTRSQRFESVLASQQSTPTQLPNSQSSDDIPIIPSAQPPLPQPGPMELGNPEVLKGPVAKGDALVTINRPTNNAN